MTSDKFEQMVTAGIDAIPEVFAKELANVAVVIEDEPTFEQRQKLHLGNHMTLFGLYEGVPLSKRGSGYSMVLPDKISIFRGPIERAAANEAEAGVIVKQTVWHEVAHHFGLDEARVRQVEIKQHSRNSE